MGTLNNALGLTNAIGDMVNISGINTYIPNYQNNYLGWGGGVVGTISSQFYQGSGIYMQKRIRLSLVQLVLGMKGAIAVQI